MIDHQKTLFLFAAREARIHALFAVCQFNEHKIADAHFELRRSWKCALPCYQQLSSCEIR